MSRKERLYEAKKQGLSMNDLISRKADPPLHLFDHIGRIGIRNEAQLKPGEK